MSDARPIRPEVLSLTPKTIRDLAHSLVDCHGNVAAAGGGQYPDVQVRLFI